MSIIRSSFTRSLALCAAALGCGMVPVLAGAQQPAQAPGTLEEVIVTAQKRAANLQDVPFSVSASSEAQIRDSGSENIVDLARNMAKGLQKEVEAGKLTKEAAIAEFSRRGNSMTFDNGAGYLFASTLDGVTVLSPDPNVWSGRALQEVFVEPSSAVLHQCIRSRIGAVLLRTIMDISARAI